MAVCMDSSHLPITGHKLNGKNFLQWSQSVIMFICEKGKDDYLTGVAVPHAKEDPKFKRWKAENNMVMSWLINSMNNDIGENFLLYETANEIWDAARETYSDNENTSELFEIEGTLHNLRQGDLLVTIHDWNCPTDGAKYREIAEKKRVYKFLLSLNKNLDEVRGRILGMKPLLNIRETFSEVRREESRKKLMMGSQNHQSTTKSLALATRGPSCQATINRQKKIGRPWCDHCRKIGHTKETCWIIHAKPTNWKPSRPQNDRESRGNHVSSEDIAKQSESSPFSKEQLELLQKMLIQFSQKGNFLSALNVKRENLSPWIVDSEASDHMTGDASISHTYKPCSNNFNVRIADGSLSKVGGTGLVVISNNLTLDSILLDLGSGKMIGSAEVCSGLYILKVNNHHGKQHY
ncbi:hypothetical protein UlMin_042420 [Ulmus minor]